MKNVICMAVIWAMSLATCWAQDARIGKIPFDVEFGQLAAFLELSPFQWEEVKKINDRFIRKQNESLKESPAKREKRMQQAIDGNLRFMRIALTNDQYRSYITLLNVTNNNRRVIVYGELPNTYLANVE